MIPWIEQRYSRLNDDLETIMSQDFHRWRRFTLEDSPFDPTTAAAHYPPDLGLEPIHLNIDLTIDIAAQRAAGVVTHTRICR